MGDRGTGNWRESILQQALRDSIAEADRELALEVVILKLSSDQLKGLADPPYPVLVPALGAGTIVVVEWIVLIYKFGTVPYTIPAGGSFAVNYEGAGGGAGAACWNASGFLDQSQNMVGISPVDVPDLADGTTYPQATVDNKAVVVSNNSTNWTDGDGTVTVKANLVLISLD